MPTPAEPRRYRWLVALTPFAVGVTFLPAGQWLLPVLAPLTLYPVFREHVRAGRYGGAWLAGMTWAALLSVGIVLLVYLAPVAAAKGILNGEPYRVEMLGWVFTGEGREVTPRAFLPEHALHLGAFLVLTAISGGYLGLVLGAGLVGYMSYFVASYGVVSGHPWVGPILAWVPWSVVRVAAFVLLGCLAARPSIVGRAWPFERRERRLFGLGLAGILIDATVKVLAAPGYGELLRRFAE